MTTAEDFVRGMNAGKARLELNGGSGGSYLLASGRVVTDADLVAEADEFEAQTWSGSLGSVRRGPAAFGAEDLVTVTVKLPRSMVDAIGLRTHNRSEFIRMAVARGLD